MGLLSVTGSLVAQTPQPAAPPTSTSTQPVAVAPAPVQRIADASNYVLQPSDLLQIRIFQEPDLDREVRVSQDHTLTLPLIGQITVRGKTLRQLEMEIRELYDRDYLVNPQVNVSVEQYATRTVNMLGQFNQPGPVVFPPEEPLRLIDAISRAGGFSRLANPASLTIQRKNPDGTTITIPVNGDKLLRGEIEDPMYLLRDDVINVRERIF